jgi:hypothetical protein
MERELKVPQDLIMGINNLSPQSLTVGQQIKIPNLEISVVIDKPQRTLTLRNKGRFLAKYPIGISSIDGRVPARTYSVVEKHPKGLDYTPEEGGATIKAGDPANPLGQRFIAITREVGIHGTTEPDKIGKYISKGYIAMTNEDVEEVYSLVRKGTEVIVRGRNLQESSSGT